MTLVSELKTQIDGLFVYVTDSALDVALGSSLPFVGENRGCLLSIFTTHFTTFAPSKHHASHQDFRKILAKAPKIHQPGASNFLVKFTTICRSKMRSYESVFCCWVADY